MVSMGKMGTFGKFSLLQNTYPPHTKVYKRSILLWLAKTSAKVTQLLAEERPQGREMVSDEKIEARQQWLLLQINEVGYEFKVEGYKIWPRL